MLEYPSPFAMDFLVSDSILPQRLVLRSRKQMPETVKIKKKGKVCIRARWPIRPALNSGFRSMKRLGILLLPPGWDASPSQGYRPAL